MPSDFTIRRWSGPDRLDDILATVQAAFADFKPPSGALDETLEHLTARLRRETVLVALAGEKIIGSVFCARKDDALYLTRMAVLPAWRRRGVGRAMVQAAERQARDLGLAALSLRVRKNLLGNRAYFERLGFALTGEGQDPGRSPYYTLERRYG